MFEEWVYAGLTSFDSRPRRQNDLTMTMTVMLTTSAMPMPIPTLAPVVGEKFALALFRGVSELLLPVADAVLDGECEEAAIGSFPCHHQRCRSRCERW